MMKLSLFIMFAIACAAAYAAAYAQENENFSDKHVTVTKTPLVTTTIIEPTESCGPSNTCGSYSKTHQSTMKQPKATSQPDVSQSDDSEISLPYLYPPYIRITKERLAFDELWNSDFQGGGSAYAPVVRAVITAAFISTGIIFILWRV
ncbi:hypothetical protein BZA77DRAFT_376797 [Pyronema omphalodes]|nr:hypothetical protein BZA77DRAFT_376797 [Pyronema omphalodes]